MEVRSSGEESRYIVHEGVSYIMTQLGNIGHVQLLNLTVSTLHTANIYTSLEPVYKFLSGLKQAVC